MINQLMILLMASLGIGLAITPATSGVNPGLMKGAAWLLSGLLSKLFKI